MSQGLRPEQLEIIKQETEKLLSEGVVMDKKTSSELDTILDNCRNIISTKMSNVKAENDKLWSTYKDEISKFAPIINDYQYTFLLSKIEYKTIRNIFFKDLSYNRNTIFQALVVRDNFFNPIENGKTVEQVFSGLKNDENIAIKITIRDIKRISDLMSMHEVKGLNKESEAFASVFKKIGDIMRIFEYYYEEGNNVGNDASEWTALGGNLEKELEEQNNSSESNTETKTKTEAES